jgi:hypothetical protein
MTDISKYKSLAVDHACYDKIDKMTKILAPGITLSRAQVIRMLVERDIKNKENWMWYAGSQLVQEGPEVGTVRYSGVNGGYSVTTKGRW